MAKKRKKWKQPKPLLPGELPSPARIGGKRSSAKGRKGVALALLDPAQRQELLAAQDQAWRRDPAAYAAANRREYGNPVRTLAQVAPDLMKKLSADTVARVDAPTTLARDLAGVNPIAAVEARTAMVLAADEGISELDAYEALRMRLELARLEAGDNPMLLSQAVGDQVEAPAPWLDTSPLAKPPQPWNDAHWERDQRRAQAAGLGVDKQAWTAHAELGRDVVGELAQQNRQQEIAVRRANLDGFLDTARTREHQRGTAANERKLDQAAAKPYQERVQRRARPTPEVFREDLQQLADMAADHRLV